MCGGQGVFGWVWIFITFKVTQPIISFTLEVHQFFFTDVFNIFMTENFMARVKHVWTWLQHQLAHMNILMVQYPQLKLSKAHFPIAWQLHLEANLACLAQR